MTTDVSELINVPREITLKNRTLKIRQLKIKEIFGYFEEKIKNKKIKEAQEMASLMSGEDKNTFLLSVWKELPSGTALTDMVIDTMASVDGVIDIIYMASRDYEEGITEDDIKALIDIENLNELSPIITWISGTKEEKPETKKKQKGKK